eukprot:1157864-Pelagomonas_calceolata.AAC.1
MPHLLQPAGQELEFIALFREVHVAPRLYMPWPRDFRVFRAKILRFLKLIAHCSTCSCCHVPFPTASWTDRAYSSKCSTPRTRLMMCGGGIPQNTPLFDPNLAPCSWQSAIASKKAWSEAAPLLVQYYYNYGFGITSRNSALRQVKCGARPCFTERDTMRMEMLCIEVLEISGGNVLKGMPWK